MRNLTWQPVVGFWVLKTKRVVGFILKLRVVNNKKLEAMSQHEPLGESSVPSSADDKTCFRPWSLTEKKRKAAEAIKDVKAKARNTVLTVSSGSLSAELRAYSVFFLNFGKASGIRKKH